MIELGLILGLNVAGLSFAIGLSRWLGSRDPGSAETRRLTGAVRRAAGTFLARENRLVALQVLVLAPALFGLHAWLVGGEAISAAFWTALGVALGALGAAASAFIAAQVALGASARTVAAARSSLDGALSVAVRAGGAAGIVAECISAIGILLLFSLPFAMQGGFGEGANLTNLVRDVVAILPGFALGAAGAGLLLQLGGSRFHTGTDVGGDIVGEAEAGLGHDDTRNPAIVADLVGDHVGQVASRTVDSFVSSATGNVAMLILGAAMLRANAGVELGTLAVLLLPLVIRGFGTIAAAFGVMVVRTTENTDPGAALWRGQIATTLIALAGMAGAVLWLTGAHYWKPLFIAGAAGAIVAQVIGHGLRTTTSRRSTAVRELLEATRTSEATAVTQGLGMGMQAAIIPAVAMGAALAFAWHVGHGTGLERGGLLALIVALATMQASGVYALAMGTFAPVADNACGIAAMASSSSTETQRRTARLDDAGFHASAVSQTHAIAAGSTAALLAAAALLRIGGPASALDPSKPAVAWSGVLGAALIFAYAGETLRSGARVARTVAKEVERQLRVFPRQGGRLAVPKEFTPTYRTCIDITARGAAERLLAPIAAVLVAPALLGALLRLSYRSSDPALPTEALAAFAVTAAVTGFAAALAAHGTRTALTSVRRHRRTSAEGPSGSVSGDAIADFMGNSAGPAAHLLAKATAVTALTVAPFLS